MGRFPTPRSRTTANELGDLGRDVASVVAGDPQARQDFVDDLLGFADLTTKPAAEAPIRELASQVLAAAVATKPSEARGRAAARAALRGDFRAGTERGPGEGAGRQRPGRRIPVWGSTT